VVVCLSHQLPEGSNQEVMLGQEEVAVWRLRGQLYAINNRCAHKRAKLSLGDIEDLGQCGAGAHMDGSTVGGLSVRCPKHQQKFGGLVHSTPLLHPACSGVVYSTAQQSTTEW
jgi:nitrite reductase/ring-hydroxylating ferredoxin subunit